MPTFDIVSEVDSHELDNAIDQANREVDNRFDFKGSEAKFNLEDGAIHLEAQSKFQLEQMWIILTLKCSKRGIDVACLVPEEIQESLHRAKQVVTVKQGLAGDMAKKIVKMIKDTKAKVQAAIQGEKIRVTGKKRDDLQEVIAYLKQQPMDLPLQFDNFRD
jgi:cyclic-di-GMP-binding protein